MAVGFFTHGIEYKLPHPPIPKRTILLICKVVKRAWQLIEEKPPSAFSLQSADEDTITQILVEIIENRLRRSGEVNGFNYAMFGRVIRGQTITNFDKNHPDKIPDIFFDLKRDKLQTLSDQDGLFVECKPVDRSHPIFSCYCKKGLIRFVNGDYAWAMQDALMIGYVRGNYSFTKLASVFEDNNKGVKMNTINHFSVDEYELYRSTHDRRFKWLEGRGNACPIEVSHLWLFV